LVNINIRLKNVQNILLTIVIKIKAAQKGTFKVLSLTFVINFLSTSFLIHTAIIEHVRDGCMVRALLLPDHYLVTVMLPGVKVSFSPSICSSMNKREPISLSRTHETLYISCFHIFSFNTNGYFSNK